MLAAAPSRSIARSRSDLSYQASILPGVSRTFALTIPVLPGRLAEVVANAYLLCRIADTIEDDPGLSNELKTVFHGQFLEVVGGVEDADAFAASLAPKLSAQILPDERDLVRNTAKIVRLTRGFTDREQRALIRCLSIMCAGMPEFQRRRSLRGLRDARELGEYCYVVAGVVGEMLTDLFCERCPELLRKRHKMNQLAVSFGQGLQMTNILKDVWDDRRSGTCWLPRSMFADRRFKLERLEDFRDSEAFRTGIDSLIAVTHRHLQNALEYTCLIPAREAGMRRFCLWALGLAVMTLQKLHQIPDFKSGDEVKVSRRTVRATMLATNLALSSNASLRWLFKTAANGLPLWQADTATWQRMVGRGNGLARL